MMFSRQREGKEDSAEDNHASEATRGDSSGGTNCIGIRPFGATRMAEIMESLILAQNERRRRVLTMQVERQGAFGRPRAADW